jgi:hypothetical protein
MEVVPASPRRSGRNRSSPRLSGSFLPVGGFACPRTRLGDLRSPRKALPYIRAWAATSQPLRSDPRTASSLSASWENNN